MPIWVGRLGSPERLPGEWACGWAALRRQAVAANRSGGGEGRRIFATRKRRSAIVLTVLSGEGHPKLESFRVSSLACRWRVPMKATSRLSVLALVLALAVLPGALRGSGSAVAAESGELVVLD